MLGLLILVLHRLLPSGSFKTRGHDIVDENGNPVWLFGFNWDGLESNKLIEPAFWQFFYDPTNGPVRLLQALDQMVAKGFNVIRVPLAVSTIKYWSQGIYPGGNGGQDVAGYDPARQNVYLWCCYDGYENCFPPDQCGSGWKPNQIDLIRAFVNYVDEKGLKIIWDLHCLHAGGFDTVEGAAREKLWYDDQISELDWINAAVWVAQNLNGSNVIGIDLANERHGTCAEIEADPSSGATWSNYRTFIQQAGKAVLNVRPNYLILVEGIECFEGVNTYWGGNLRGVGQGHEPISFTDPDTQLVYSPHEFGPGVYAAGWFCDHNLTWDRWAYDHVYPDYFEIYQKETAPVLIGAWGRDSPESTDTSAMWFNATVGLIYDWNVSQTYWGGLNVKNVSSLFVGWDEETDSIIWNNELLALILEVPLRPTTGTAQQRPANCPPIRTATVSQSFHQTPYPTVSVSPFPTDTAKSPTEGGGGESEDYNLLPVGALIGMTIGAVAAVIIAVVVLVCLFRNRKDLGEIKEELNPDKEAEANQNDDNLQF